jgi:hypothetical protein
MKTLTFLSLAAFSMLAGCASESADDSSSSEGRVAAASFAGGEFKLYDIANHEPIPGCDLYTYLKLEAAEPGIKATLQTRADGACPVDFADDTRQYALRVEDGSCGSKFYKSVSALPPVDVNQAISISDFRQATCVDVDHVFQVEETRGTAKRNWFGVEIVAAK